MISGLVIIVNYISSNIGSAYQIAHSLRSLLSGVLQYLELEIDACFLAPIIYIPITWLLISLIDNPLVFKVNRPTTDSRCQKITGLILLI
jgi:hypothetical protein